MRRTGSWAVAASLAIGVAVIAGVSVRTEYAGPEVAPTPGLPSPVVRSSEHVQPEIPTSLPSSRPSLVPPPDRSIHISDRYANHYGARPASWDDVIDSGKSFPAVTDGCARSWRSSGRDGRLDWDSARFMCLDALPGRAFRPQGVGGSATTDGYHIDGKPAADRNIILTSWYSRAREPDLFAPDRAGGIVTRLVVMDMDQRRYNSVELVRPDGSRTLRNLSSHGSGLVWAGQYLYSSSRSELWMYNADDIMSIDGRYVLPAVARWTVNGDGALSSISLDRSTTPDRLWSINYSKSGQAYIQSFDLAADGSLAPNGRRNDSDLTLTNRFGQPGRVVHSATATAVPGESFQGVAGAGAFAFANSSSMRISGRKGVDAVAVLKGGDVVQRYQMPHGNVQSIYLDYRRGTYVSITERGSQFLFQLPVKSLTKKSE